MRSGITTCMLVLATFAAGATDAVAQSGSFGLGARIAMVRTDAAVDADSVRFIGGQLRAAMSKRTAIEISLDVRTENTLLLTERVKQYPLQASLLLYPVRSVISPYILGGVGWYSRKVETLVGGEANASVTTRRFGSHAGFGAELSLGRHLGVHADYRYTFLHFGSDRDNLNQIPGSRFFPGFEGSMWTAGATVYF